MSCGRFIAFWLLLAFMGPVAVAEEWKAGLAKVAITPSEPTWLSGYSSRSQPADGKVHDLYAKAVAIEGADRTRLVEGGYEGRSGIVHQLTATPFLPSVEDRVMQGIARLVDEVQ